MLIDKAELSKGLALATAGLREGEVFELRVLPSGHSGTFRGAKEARATLSKLAALLGAWDGAYFMPNPMAGEPTNALKTGKAGRDVDVTRRRWLLLDVDPERPKVPFPGGGEGKASATEHEKAHAWDLRARIVADLRDVWGFADPVMSDSGNGYHAMWAVDLPADSDVPERFLATLARVYDTDAAKVDRVVKNAARIWKLPGTLACKGPNLAPERPWRMAKVEAIPKELHEVVPEAMSLMLESLATAPEPAASHRSGTASATFSEAREQYKAERTPAWPVKVGTCPVCRHNGCFCALPGGTGKWFCFSSDHQGAGRYTGRGWMGDVIDIDCHTSGKTERELLLSAGYLEDRPPKRERGSAEPPAWASEVIPVEGDERPVPVAVRSGVKPEIRVRLGDLDGMMSESAASMANDETIYTRGGELVEACVTPDGFRLVPLVKPTLRAVLERNATWIQMVKRTDKDGNVSMVEAVANVNDRVVEGMLKAPRLWAHLRHVQNVHGLPVVRMDGSVAGEGYDPVTRLLIRYDGVKFGEIGTTRGQASAALEALKDLFCQFPFESEQDRAVAVCLCVMACVRRVLPLSPGVLVDSPSSGIGKGLLINVASILASGREADPMQQPKEEDELGKTLFSALRDGAHHIAFDNVSGQFGGEAYDMLMTAPVFKGRILGQSVIQAVPASALVTVTGRNVMFRGDAAGRTLRCKLVTPLERPDEGREFKYPQLERHVASNRGVIVAQVLTIVRAYLLAGRPCEMRPLRMYYEWGAMAREPLVWLGMVDPVESITHQRVESDSDLAAYGELTHAMYEAFGDRAMTMAKLVREATLQGPWFEKRERLREAIQEVAGVEPTSARCSAALGYRLRKNAGRPVDGLVLDRATREDGSAGRSAGGVMFHVRIVGDGPAHTKPPEAPKVVNIITGKAEAVGGW